jgi:hypothetical protein
MKDAPNAFLQVRSQPKDVTVDPIAHSVGICRTVRRGSSLSSSKLASE